MPKTSTRKADHLKRLRDAVRNVLAFDSALRPPASDGGPGGLIEFPAREKREFIIIGDLHGNHKNLRAILDHEKNLQKVEQNKAVILFLGDAVHNDRSGFAYEMESSIETMDIIIGLINDYPQNVIYLLGNHDSFEPELSKMGIQQGLLYRDALISARGKQYVGAMQDFFDGLPLFVIHRHFLAVHAGPPRGGVTRMELVNVRHFQNLVWQLTWNRLNETRSTPSMKEYGPEDLDAARKLLECPPEIPDLRGPQSHVEVGGGGFHLDRCPGHPASRDLVRHAGNEVPLHFREGFFQLHGEVRGPCNRAAALRS